MHLADAQADRRRRGEQLALSTLVALSDELCNAVEQLSNADRVGPDKRKKLSGLLNHYRKMAHPFTACVRDNTKRFGPDGAKKVCAVLTDIEKGTTRWRNGGNHSKVNAAHLSLSQDPVDPVTVIDDELFSLLSKIAETDYKSILGLEA